MKERYRRLLFVLVFIGLAWLCQSPRAALAWERQYPPEPMEALHGVWASDVQNVYAVGSDGLIYRYDGLSWTMDCRRENTTLAAVWGFGPTDVFAAGSNGTVLYYNGIGWNELATGIEDDLTGIWGDSPGNLYVTTIGGRVYHFDGNVWTPAGLDCGSALYAVRGGSGADVYVAGADGSVYRFDGDDWQDMSVDDPVTLRGIWGVSGDLFAVGDGGVILHHDGSAWAREDGASDLNLTAVYGTGGRVAAVGEAGMLSVFSGGAWQTSFPQVADDLTGVYAVSASDFFVSSASGRLYRLDGFSLTALNEPLPARLSSVSGDGQRLFAVGEAGTILEYTGSGWTNRSGAVDMDLYAVAGSADTGLFAVGAGGAILAYDAGDWVAMEGPVIADLKSLFVAGDGTAAAVGLAGTVLSFDGKTWQTVPVPTTADLFGITGDGNGRLVAVGSDGVILEGQNGIWTVTSGPATGTLFSVWTDGAGRFLACGQDGVVLERSSFGWSAMPTPVDLDLHAIWGDGTGDLFAAGERGLILRYNGRIWTQTASPTGQSLNGLWGGSAGVFAVGDAATILHQDESAYQRLTITQNGEGSVKAVPGETLSFDGMQTADYEYGTPVVLQFTPAAGYAVEDVRVDGQSSGAVPEYAFGPLTADHAVEVDFVRQTHIITSSAGAGGIISPSGAVVVTTGASQLFIITPNSGFIVNNVLVDGVSQGAIYYYTFQNVQTDHTISVTFTAGTTRTISPSSGANGGIYPNWNVSVTNGGSQFFYFTPASGYTVQDVLVDGLSQGASYNYTFNNVTADHTIAVTFTAGVSYTITPTAGSNGTISPNWPVSMDSGASQTFTITPDTGYRVSSVLVDGVSVGAVTSYTFTNVTSNHTIAVTFERIVFAITASATTGGAISPSGTVAVYYGNSQTFTMTAAGGYHLADVLVDGSSVGAVASYTFSNVTQNHTIAAQFVADSYIITSTAGAGGTINPLGSVTVSHGSNQTFTITAATGYAISDVRVDGTSVGAVSTYTFTNVSSAHTISATFAIQSFTITSTANTGGTISPLGATVVTYGGSQTYTITPSTGYDVSDVLVDGISVGVVYTYTFAAVAANHTIQAVFSVQTYTIIASSSLHGTISPSGNVSVNYHANQSFTITADTNYNIIDILVDNVSIGAITSNPYTYTFTSVAANHTIHAVFGDQNTVTAVPTVSDSTPTSGDTVTLDGSHSNPSTGLTYTWTQSAGTPTVLFYDETAVSTTFVAPVVTTTTQLTFTLTVSDGQNSDSENIVVTVSPTTLSVSGAPSDAYIILSSEGTSIGVKVTDGSASGLTVLRAYDPANIGTTTNRPDDLPYGLVQLSARLATGQSTLQLTFYLPTATTSSAGWYRYVSGTGWLDYTAHVTFNSTYTQVTVNYTDNSSGDSDATTGRITDLSGLGVNATPPVVVRNNSAGGGCFIGSLE